MVRRWCLMTIRAGWLSGYYLRRQRRRESRWNSARHTLLSLVYSSGPLLEPTARLALSLVPLCGYTLFFLGVPISHRCSQPPSQIDQTQEVWRKVERKLRGAEALPTAAACGQAQPAAACGIVT